MKRMFLFLTVIAVLTAPAVSAEAAETTQRRGTTIEVREKQSRTEERLEERLLKEAKRIAREIAGAQRAAKKAERLEGRKSIKELRALSEKADREEKKELREEISKIRENKKFDSLDEFLDNMTLIYDDLSVKSEKYVVSVAAARKNLDATVTYDNKTKTLTLTAEGLTVKVTLDAEGAYVNGDLLYKFEKDREETEEEEVI